MRSLALAKIENAREPRLFTVAEVSADNCIHTGEGIARGPSGAAPPGQRPHPAHLDRDAGGLAPRR